VSYALHRAQIQRPPAPTLALGITSAAAQTSHTAVAATESGARAATSSCSSSSNSTRSTVVCSTPSNPARTLPLRTPFPTLS